MNLKIDGLECVCVPLEDADFSDVAAIYFIICLDRKAKKYTVIDIGQSGELGTRIDNHDRRECWKKKCPQGEIWVCIYKMPTSKFSKEERLSLEKELRSNNSNLCGKR